MMVSTRWAIGEMCSSAPASDSGWMLRTVDLSCAGGGALSGRSFRVIRLDRMG